MSDEHPLTRGVDFLFILAIFYALIQSTQLHSWQGLILWLALFLIILNEQLSVRSSYDVYNGPIYALDLFSLFLYVSALYALTTPNNIYGYSPTYWLAIAFLWVSYALWDFVVLKQAYDEGARKSLLRWSRYMLLCAPITLLSFLAIYWSESYVSFLSFHFINMGGQVLGLLIILWVLYVWNKERLNRLKDFLMGRDGR